MEIYEEEKLEGVDQVFNNENIRELNRRAQMKEAARVYRLLKAKARQLPPEKPGLVLFETIHPLNIHMLQDTISHYGQTHQHFLGLLLISHNFALNGFSHTVTLLRNVHAHHHPMNIAAVRAILELDGRNG